MVVSILNNNIHYSENVDIEPNDIGQKLDMFQLEIFNQNVIVVIGAHVSFYRDQNVIFYPIYLVTKNQQSIKIGVFEILLFDFSQLKGDETSQVDSAIQLFFTEPLLFGYVNNEFLEKYAHREIVVEPPKPKPNLIVINKPKPKIIDAEPKVSKYIIPKPVEKILELEKEMQSELLPMETIEDIAKKYTELKSPIWIQQLLENNNYNILQNEKKMCILTILVNMFQQNGFAIDEQNIQNFIANKINERVFQQYKENYTNYTRLLVEKTKLLALIKKSLKNVGDAFLKLQTHEQKEKMYPQLKQLETDQNVIANEVKYYREQLICVKFMENVNSVADLRQFIVSNNCYCDEWILQTLERAFNIQFVLLNNITNLGTRVSTKVDKKTNVNKDELFKIIKFRQRQEDSQTSKFVPFYYLILEQIENSFYPIRYYKKGFLQFQELPPDLNMLLYQSIQSNPETVYTNNTFLSKKQVAVVQETKIIEMSKQSLMTELSYYTMNETTRLDSILSFRRKETFQFQDQDYVRYHINTDGHCLFDTIAFLYLYHKQNESKCYLEELGWVPKVVSMKNSVFAKGNLMDIIVNKRAEITERADLSEYPQELKIINDWINMYIEKYFNKKSGIKGADYPSTELILWLFPSIFDTLQYRFCSFTFFDSQLIKTPIYPMTAIDCNDNSNIQTIYCFNKQDHFEPVTSV